MSPDSTQRPLFIRGLLALVAPRRFSEPFVHADDAAELSRNVPMRQASSETELEHLNATRQKTVDRLFRLRRALLGSLLSMGSAVFVAESFRVTNITPMLPRPVLAVGSIFCFAVATLSRLGWGGPPISGDTSAEQFDQRLLHVLYWIGMCWGALAIL